jgi:phenylalanyl-tRNA synthetase beta chain
MRFSERWLRTLADPAIDGAGLADALTMAGLEVEDVAPAAPEFSGVVVARIAQVAAHPDAERLRVCSVDAGTGSPLQIVCGAPNAAAGMKVPCALPGARLPGGIAIAKATMRGVESAGMLCSGKELGIDDDASGLLALPVDAKVGTDLRAALDLDDRLLTLKLTPNRADCLSIVGVARDVAAATGAAFRLPVFTPAEVTSPRRRPIRIEDRDACGRFVARVIEGIDPRAPTPDWMRQRLSRSGIRPISAVVDVTNYVMLEQGQPLHAYDDARLEGGIVVRFARAGEKLTLLNGQVLDLEPDLLLVCDEKKPLGLAGIMGGEDSGIGDATTSVFLEGAFWNPSVIQGRSRRLGFVSDAGYRFERGVDFANAAHAVERASQLIVEICGGRAGPLDDVAGELPRRDPVRVRVARVTRLLGVAIPAADIARIFTRLGFAFIREGDDFVVTPPPFRFDLAIEEDFVEEVARLHGYDAIPTSPSAHVQAMLADPEAAAPLAALKDRLVARDWQEVITFSFVSSTTESTLQPDRPGDTSPIAVRNPIAGHLDVMRTTLAGGLIDVLRTNLARQQDRVRIFETGRCFRRDGEQLEQPLLLGGLGYGDAAAEQWGAPGRALDYFDVKGDLEALVAPRTLTTVRTAHPALHPGRAARVLIDGRDAGWIGELHPRLVRHFELPRAPVVFELELAGLAQRAVPVAAPISKLPVARRDFAVVVDAEVPAQDVLDVLLAAKPARVPSIRLFDVYRGPGIAVGKKSLAILVLIQDTERTLTDAEIDETVAHLLRVLQERFGATLRQQGLR